MRAVVRNAERAAQVFGTSGTDALEVKPDMGPPIVATLLPQCIIHVGFDCYCNAGNINALISVIGNSELEFNSAAWNSTGARLPACHPSIDLVVIHLLKKNQRISMMGMVPNWCARWKHCENFETEQ